MNIRFAVHDDEGRRSAIWSIFTMGGANIGMTTAEAGGNMKISLHESGSWQIGYTSEYEKCQRAAGNWVRDTRHWEIWRRPAEFRSGYTPAIKVLVPREALKLRSQLSSKKPIRWMKARADRAVSFTIWITRSTVPPWGYGADHELLGTIAPPSGEYVLIAGHYVDATDALRVMLRGLGGFVRTLMEGGTSKLEPLPMESALMGFSAEPSGIRTISEIALWSLTSMTGADERTVSEQRLVRGVTVDLAVGLMEIEVPIPRSVFAERGVDPEADPEAAKQVVHEWNEMQAAELRRLLRLPAPG